MTSGASVGDGHTPVRIIVLGATGSVGQSLANLIQRNPEKFDVVALVANQNATALAEMARKLSASSAVLADPAKHRELAELLQGSGIKVGSGDAAVMDCVEQEAELVVGAIVGAAGLRPTMAAVKSDRRIALANKECLVCAGELFMARVRQAKAELLPMDSEHNAIFQVFETEQAHQIEKVILTASGGPFRTFSTEEMSSVTPQQALKHPNWEMGSRITIDSATMMNKGFEVIEASHLFPVEHDQLDVLVHPQSMVHGLVQYKDGSLLAHLGSPDMRTPIAHCLSFPQRMEVPVKRLNLAELGTLTFEAPDLERFPALRLALEAMKLGDVASAALNAADEVAVEAFLHGRIGFLDIPAAIEVVLEDLATSGSVNAFSSVEDVLDLDGEVRRKTSEWIKSRCA
ncbi:MAG: 1-deoxy-D-xylulose-5-phosphate reductoisomerase [Pseudomonadota bacterium]